MPDFSIKDIGSLVLVRPLTDDAKAWIDANCQAEDWMWFGGALAVEHRYVNSIVEGLTNGGYTT